MLKQQARLFRNIAIAADFFAIVAAYILAYEISRAAEGLAELTDYLWALLIIIPVRYFFFAQFGLYSSMRTLRLADILAAIIKAHIASTVVASCFLFFIDPEQFSRVLFLYSILLSILFVSLQKTVFMKIIGYFRRKGYNFRNILILGVNENSLELARLIQSHDAWGLRVSGFLQHDDTIYPANQIDGHKVLGRLEDVVEVCKANAVDEVVFCLQKIHMYTFDDCLLELEDMGITVRMVLEFYASRSHRKELSYFNEQIPIMTFYCKPFNSGQLFFKRLLDVAGALVGLFLTLALFPFIALAIKLNSPGPLLFGQTRVCENGRLFTCWKFRSMYVDAEARKQELMHLNEMEGAIFKIANDPRITSVGGILRKSSLDELPQFWNVLRGDMSLVGTRPPTPAEVAQYENWHRKRICIKPGITGLWQVSGRNQIQNFDEIVRLDLEYIEKWTFWLDVKILLKTIWVVFKRDGSS